MVLLCVICDGFLLELQTAIKVQSLMGSDGIPDVFNIAKVQYKKDWPKDSRRMSALARRTYRHHKSYALQKDEPVLPRVNTEAAPCATTFKTLEASWHGLAVRLEHIARKIQKLTAEFGFGHQDIIERFEELHSL